MCRSGLLGGRFVDLRFVRERGGGLSWEWCWSLGGNRFRNGLGESNGRAWVRSLLGFGIFERMFRMIHFVHFSFLTVFNLSFGSLMVTVVMVMMIMLMKMLCQEDRDGEGTYTSLLAPMKPPRPIDMAPATSSASPPRITRCVVPIEARPAVKANGTVRPSLRPRIAS